jgi:hypothetical protein
VQRAGGLVVLLTRGQAGDAHESETALDGPAGAFVDCVLDNRVLSLTQTKQALVDFLVRQRWARSDYHVPEEYPFGEPCRN